MRDHRTLECQGCRQQGGVIEEGARAPHQVTVDRASRLAVAVLAGVGRVNPVSERGDNEGVEVTARGVAVVHWLERCCVVRDVGDHGSAHGGMVGADEGADAVRAAVATARVGQQGIAGQGAQHGRKRARELAWGGRAAGRDDQLRGWNRETATERRARRGGRR